MNNQEYEQKKRECLLDFCKEYYFIESVADVKEIIGFAFDRAYALGLQSKAITQEEIEKAAEEYVYERQKIRHYAKKEEDATMRDFDKTIKAWDAYDMEQAFESGANLFIGKQEKDTEGEEMLCVPRKKVEEKWQRAYEQEEKYSRAQDSAVAREELYYNRGILSILDTLFGSNCLPDENSSKVEKLEKIGKPKPTETCTDDCSSQCPSSDHIPDPTKMIDDIIKGGFREHNRLQIAAMAMHGILSNSYRMKQYGEIAMRESENLTQLVARNALRYADAIIAECDKK